MTVPLLMGLRRGWGQSVEVAAHGDARVSAPELLETLAGRWKGTSTLVLPTLAPSGSISDSTATVGSAARGKFARIEHTWAYEGAPHEGVLLVGTEKKNDVGQAVWIDSWHQSEKFMLCEGRLDSSGAIDLIGHSPAPTGPDWGWRTAIRSRPGGWELVMHNVSPEGEETLAFRNVYERA
jgi:hypothetical protein